MKKSLKVLIISHICYRDVFNAPVHLDDLKKWIGINEKNEGEFRDVISALKLEGLIEEKENYLVPYGNLALIRKQGEKEVLTKKLIYRGTRFLQWFGKLPFVKFIGISGSLAAKNPTLDVKGLNKGNVDIDLFVISRANTLWILFLIERVLTNVYKLLFRELFYCFNYVTDESFLEIHNKNFFTATELNNLIPIYDKGVFGSFVNENLWCRKYYKIEYPEFSKSKNKKLRFWSIVFAPLNYACFVLFCVGRAFKRLEVAPILEIGTGFNPANKCNLKRIANGNGGYQGAIKARFQEMLQLKFTKYYTEDLILDLFPVDESFNFTGQNVYDIEFGQLFGKYANP